MFEKTTAESSLNVGMFLEICLDVFLSFVQKIKMFVQNIGDTPRIKEITKGEVWNIVQEKMKESPKKTAEIMKRRESD